MIFKRLLGTAAFAGSLLFTAVAVLPAQAAPQYQDQFGRLRGLVDRTQSDLRVAADLQSGGDKQRGRYRDAQKDLSDFDRRLTKDHFDRGKLNHSIGRIKDILDHNTLQARSRDALLHDIEDLRMARDHFTH